MTMSRSIQTRQLCGTQPIFSYFAPLGCIPTIHARHHLLAVVGWTMDRRMKKAMVIRALMEVLLSGEVPDNYIDMQKQISKTWSCHLLMSQGEAWITSDNPVLTLAVQKSYTSNYISSNNT